MTQALEAAAKADTEKIDYINTHGTATRVGDKVEIEAIKATFGSDVPLISSTKSMTGHAMGAAGALEAVYTLAMMREKFIAPTINLDNVDPDCDGVPHVTETMAFDLRTAMSISAGLGGTNASLVFRTV